MPEIDRLDCPDQPFELDFVENGETPTTPIQLRIQL